MAEQAGIKQADLARYWNCSRANVTLLVQKKGMPPFSSLREADAWRAVNAPIRKLRQSCNQASDTSQKKPVESAEKSPDSPSTTTSATKAAPTGTPAGQMELAPAAAESVTPAAPRIDVSSFITPGADFLRLQVRNAEELSQITYGLLRRSTETGEPNAIAAASRNWHETSRAAADVIERFIAIEKEVGTLIPLDKVENVIATDLEEIRKGLKRLGKRAGAAANPQNPALAERAIDDAVDRLLDAFNQVSDRARHELAVEESP